MLMLARKSEIVFLDYSFGYAQTCFLINNQNLKKIRSNDMNLVGKPYYILSIMEETYYQLVTLARHPSRNALEAKQTNSDQSAQGWLNIKTLVKYVKSPGDFTKRKWPLWPETGN